MDDKKILKVVTIGWEPEFAKYLAYPIQKETGIKFIHGVIGNTKKFYNAKKKHPNLNFIHLTKYTDINLSTLDLSLLKKLEASGIPPISSMIQGDRVLRNRNKDISLSYANKLAKNIIYQFTENSPDLILASFDNIHSSISLAVGRYMNIPWVALSFTVIPSNFTAFCKNMNPDSLVPICRRIDKSLLVEAKNIVHSFRNNKVAVFAYHAHFSFYQYFKSYKKNFINLLSRILEYNFYGLQTLIYPSIYERVKDITRRSFNRLFLPERKMLKIPPKDKYAYFPLHMYPESTIDSWAPYYQDQLILALQISLTLPIDMNLLVKIHFSDPDNYSKVQLNKLMNKPNIGIIHPKASGRLFLEGADLVFGITGTACLEAALLGKPVIIFGNSPYQHFPRTEKAKQFSELHAQIILILRKEEPSENEIIEAFAKYLSRYLPGRINDWNRPINEQELKNLTVCFNLLKTYVSKPENKKNWYKTYPFSSN